MSQGGECEESEQHESGRLGDGDLHVYVGRRRGTLKFAEVGCAALYLYRREAMKLVACNDDLAMTLRLIYMRGLRNPYDAAGRFSQLTSAIV